MAIHSLASTGKKIFAFVSDSEFLLLIYSIEEMYYDKYFKKIFSHTESAP